MHGHGMYVNEGLPLHGAYLKKTLQILYYVFEWLHFIHCLTSFSSIDYLQLYAGV